MLDRADAILKLCAALAILIAGCGVGYYYGIFLPNHAESQAARHEASAEQARREARSRAEAEQARRQQTARVEYEDCVNFAELSYKNRWAASCRAMRENDIAEFEDCLDDLFATEESCRLHHPIRPERGCALPSQIGLRLSGERDQAKEQCLGKLQASQPG